MQAANTAPAGHEDFDATTRASQLLEEMSERIAEQLARHWVIARLIRNVKIAMADIPACQTRVRTRRKKADGSVFYETTVIEVYEHDAAAVVASCRLLLAECDRRETMELAIKANALGGAEEPAKSLGARWLEKHYGKLPRERGQDDKPGAELGPDDSDELPKPGSPVDS